MSSYNALLAAADRTRWFTAQARDRVVPVEFVNISLERDKAMPGYHLVKGRDSSHGPGLVHNEPLNGLR